MSDFTPPTGGNLLHTSEPNPGDRIAGALASLDATPPPGWLWALWATSRPEGHRDPLVGAIPPDAAVIRVGEGVGFDAAPPHYGMVSRDALPPYGDDGPKGPEVFAGHLVRMFATGMAPKRCMCGACITTGMPPGMTEYLSTEVAAPMEWAPGHTRAGLDPGASVRHVIALEVASARAMREHYIHALQSGRTPAGWEAQAMDPDYPGHYMARMSDTGLAAGMCAVLWWAPLLDEGLPHLYPVEVYAALAAGFSYPVPVPYSDEWHAQAEAEEGDKGAFSCEVLRHTAQDLSDILEDGRPPWEARNDGPCEVTP